MTDTAQATPAPTPATEQPPTTPATDTAPATAPAAEATPAPAPQDPASKAFAVIAKKERALIEREKALKAELAKFEEAAKPLREAMELIRGGNALDGLSKLGVDYASLTKSVLGKPKADPTEPIKSELEQIKAQLSARERAEAEHARQQAVAQVRMGIEAHVREKADTYPILGATPDGIDQVYALIERHAQETTAQGQPELLPFDEAASLVEQQLRAGLEVLAPVFRRLYPSGAETPATKTAAPESTTAPTHTGTDAPKTISNLAAAASAPRSQPPPRTLAEIERERLRRAEQVLAGKR